MATMIVLTAEEAQHVRQWGLDPFQETKDDPETRWLLPAPVLDNMAHHVLYRDFLTHMPQEEVELPAPPVSRSSSDRKEHKLSQEEDHGVHASGNKKEHKRDKDI